MSHEINYQNDVILCYYIRTDTNFRIDVRQKPSVSNRSQNQREWKSL